MLHDGDKSRGTAKNKAEFHNTLPNNVLQLRKKRCHVELTSPMGREIFRDGQTIEVMN